MNAEGQNADRRADRPESKFGHYPKRKFLACDCETDPFKKQRIPKPFIWGCYDGSEYHEFEKTEDFLAFVCDLDCICYAHNGGRFDWHYLLEFVGPFTDCMVISGRLARFKIGRAEFRDSYNLMPMPQRAAAGKLEIEDFSIFESPARELSHNKEIIRARLRSDCVGLYAMLETFFLEFGFHLTVASASMSCWSELSGIPKPETTADFYERLSPFYYGGRVECYRTGEVNQRFKIIDINSAYPYAMTFKHPYGEIPDESMSLPNSRSAIQRSFITIETDSVGCFPFRSEDGSLIFPADNCTRVFHVTGWEFLAALETGAVTEYAIRSVLQLPESIEFNQYVDYFYKMKTDAKAANDSARYEFAKRFICSPYGKFGSNPDNYSEYQLVPPRFIEQAEAEDGYLFCTFLGPHALMSRPLSEPKKRFYNVAVSASVTGFIRAYDWRAMCAVRQGGAEIFYIDTDCLHATDSGSLELHETKLGAWKIEAKCKYGAYAGKKTYACETEDGKWKKASKGVKLTVEEIIRVARGETVEFEPDVPQYSMKNGIRFINRKIRRTVKDAQR